MGYVAAAVFCAAVILASVWAGTVLGVLGVCIYAYLDRAFGVNLQRGRSDAYKAGYDRGKLDGERLRAYTESPLPKTRQEAFETKEWAEGLSALFPSDPELKKEVDRITKERKTLDSVD
jgi:hypothetical protein